MFYGTANVPLFLCPAFAIDRVRCGFRARNAPRSFRRLLTLASDAAPAVCDTYFRTAAHRLLNVLRAR